MTTINPNTIDSYGFKTSEHKTRELTADEIAYFDLETVSWQDGINEGSYDGLNIRKVGITCFCIIFPWKWFRMSTREKWSSMGLAWSRWDPDETKTEMKEKRFCAITYYNENRGVTEQILREVILEELAAIRTKDTYIVGFNNAKFDNLLFEGELQEEMNSFRFRINGDEKQVTNLIFADLKRWTDAYGMKKLADVGDYLHFPKAPRVFESEQQFKDYCEIDVKILTHFACHLNEHGNFALTPASQARRFFGERFGMKLLTYSQVEEEGTVKEVYTPCYRIYSNFEQTEHVRLFGGRTEPYFAIGKGLVYLDINSLYPYVESTIDFPALRRKKKYAVIDSKLFAGGPGSANEKRFHASIDAMREDVVKLCKSLGGRAITPDRMREIYERHVKFFGTFKVQLTGFHRFFKEYENQLRFYFPFPRSHEGKHVVFSYEEGATYDVQFYETLWLVFFEYRLLAGRYYIQHEKFPLRDTILELYEERKALKATGDKRERAIKNILNSGYGIFATRKKKEINVDTTGERAILIQEWKERGYPEKFWYSPEGEERGYDIYVRQGGSHIKKVGIDLFDERYSNNTIPIYAICITSGARFTLYSYMLNVVLSPKELHDDPEMRIYYCDTDSLFTTPLIYAQLEAAGCIGKNLGQLKVEEESCDGVFLAPKSYILSVNGKVKRIMKGTGAVFERNIVTQSLRKSFAVFARQALNPTNRQKRKLVEDENGTLKFIATVKPEPGSEILQEIYEQQREMWKEEVKQKEEQPA